jgi:hypothetical protein
MFEDRKTPGGVKIILPHIEPRPVSQQLVKRPTIHKRPHTVDPIDHRTPLERLKLLRKLNALSRRHTHKQEVCFQGSIHSKKNLYMGS